MLVTISNPREEPAANLARVPPVSIVIPTIREDCLKRFLTEWEGDFQDTNVIVVEDNPHRSFDVPEHVTHVSWEEIEADLGSQTWIIPNRTSAIRSYGTLLAYRAGAEIIWHLDDDCYPEEDIKGTYISRLRQVFSRTWSDDQWWNTIDSSGFYPRGYPYGVRATTLPTMVHHGLWSNVPDFDGITQLTNPDFRLPPCETLDRVPHGKLFPMCGMNLAFRRQVAPLMYMMLQGKNYPFDRFDDMWCGLFMKLTADHLGWVVTSGAPSIAHSKASDAARNKAVEAPGVIAHERLWQDAKNVSLVGCKTPVECYWRFSEMIGERAGKQDDPAYWAQLSGAMRRWTRFF
jgi:hypothetical protein